MSLMTPTATSYETLSPDMVLDALDSVGLRGDGRLLALNSYENRVYQIGMEEGPPVVAKFYRPSRWSDAQILEEHAFVAELQRMSVVAHSVGAVVAGAWVHDFAPPIRGLVLATAAFRVRLYVPLAVPALRLRQRFLGPGLSKYVRSIIVPIGDVPRGLFS